MFRNMRIIWIAAALLITCLALSPSWAQTKKPSLVKKDAVAKEATDKAVALVNGKEIPQGIFDLEVEKIKEVSALQGEELTATQINALKQDILEKLINYELLWQQSVKQKVPVSEQEIGSEIVGLKRQFPDENTFKKTMADLGISESELKSRIKKSFAVRGLIEKEVTSKIGVTGEESEAFYREHPEYFKEPERVQASHILIGVKEGAAAADKQNAQKKIAAIEKRLKKGEDFETIAREESQCPSSSRGGDLGFFERGNMVEPFEKAAFALQPNEISPVVETIHGYHLIKVTAKKPEREIPFVEAQENITRHLKEQKTNRLVEEYVESLRKGAKIERFL